MSFEFSPLSEKFRQMRWMCTLNLQKLSLCPQDDSSSEHLRTMDNRNIVYWERTHEYGFKNHRPTLKSMILASVFLVFYLPSVTLG